MENNNAIQCDCGFTWKKNPYQNDKEIILMADAHMKNKHPFWKPNKITFTPNSQKAHE